MNACESEVEEDVLPASRVLADIERDVGGEFSMPIAVRAKLCAEKTLKSADDEAMLVMLEEGWDRRLSREQSAAKRAARDAIIKASRQGEDGEASVQLSFPIISPERPPSTLAKATNELIRLAIRSERQQLRGREQNIRFMEKWEEKTRPFPGRPVEDLIREGLLSYEDLGVSELKDAG